ncbi:MAG: ligase-associated DNA damage response DEXH box helicase [Phycisphaerales bacterium]
MCAETNSAAGEPTLLGLDRVRDWFRSRGWRPFEFQEAAWDAYLQGRSGLIHAPTGLGKTMAAWLGPVIETLNEGRAVPGPPRGGNRGRRAATDPLRVIWLTPLRALANDTLASISGPVDSLGLGWSIEKRTGDTSSSVRLKQKERLPTALVTTPESLSLLLSYPDWREKFRTLRAVVVDEWHELMGTKRGVQTELALARLRGLVPGLRTWGVSATLGNLEQARDVLLGEGAQGAERGVLIRGDMPKELRITTVIPRDPERFPWAGHLGIRAVEEVIETIGQTSDGEGRKHGHSATLLFTNTRSQAEIWFRRLTELREDWLGEVAIHHGSLDRSVRDKVEALLDQGRLRCVVCTSSLDLGVDFQPVDRVFQLGSPKGIARLVQRAGRSGHRPGAASAVVGVPTHSFELVEFAAARDAALAGRVEARPPLDRPLDVLVQHLVTCACGGGFDEGSLLGEVRSTHAFGRMTDEQWTWAMDFVRRGGRALTAYPEYARIARREDGLWFPASDRIARMHRLSIGTITADQAMTVQYASGRRLGTVEESFVAWLMPGSRFVFAGKVLELVKVRGMTVHVRPAKRRSATVPKWNGGRFPLSSRLARAVREKLDQARRGVFDGPEMQAARPLLRVQGEWSMIPAPDELLVEHITVPGPEDGGGGSSAVIYPFEGRLVHEGLGAVAAYRLSRTRPVTVVATCNDYGLALHSAQPLGLDESGWRALLSPDGLLDDLLACLNTTELARRQFRDIARVAGLIVPGFPGQRKGARQLQASSEMFFDVLSEFDPDNLLLDQARREVLEAQLEIGRLRSAIERAADQRLRIVTLDRLTPLAFPIWAEHLRSIQLSSEKWSAMVERMVMKLDEAADGPQHQDREGPSRRAAREGGYRSRRVSKPGRAKGGAA